MKKLLLLLIIPLLFSCNKEKKTFVGVWVHQADESVVQEMTFNDDGSYSSYLRELSVGEVIPDFMQDSGKWEKKNNQICIFISIPPKHRKNGPDYLEYCYDYKWISSSELEITSDYNKFRGWETWIWKRKN